MKLTREQHAELARVAPFLGLWSQCFMSVPESAQMESDQTQTPERNVLR